MSDAPLCSWFHMRWQRLQTAERSVNVRYKLDKTKPFSVFTPRWTFLTCEKSRKHHSQNYRFTSVKYFKNIWKYILKHTHTHTHMAVLHCIIGSAHSDCFWFLQCFLYNVFFSPEWTIWDNPNPKWHVKQTGRIVSVRLWGLQWCFYIYILSFSRCFYPKPLTNEENHKIDD